MKSTWGSPHPPSSPSFYTPSLSTFSLFTPSLYPPIIILPIQTILLLPFSTPSSSLSSLSTCSLFSYCPHLPYNYPSCSNLSSSHLQYPDPSPPFTVYPTPSLPPPHLPPLPFLSSSSTSTLFLLSSPSCHPSAQFHLLSI